MAMLQPRLGWSDGEYSPMAWTENAGRPQGFNELDLVDHMLCAKAQTYYFSHGSSLLAAHHADQRRARSTQLRR